MDWLLFAGGHVALALGLWWFAIIVGKVMRIL